MNENDSPSTVRRLQKSSSDPVFAVLPYVTTARGCRLQIGSFELWRNCSAEWSRVFNVDNTSFIDLYRKEDGTGVGESASILTRSDRAGTLDEFRDVIHCLSTAVWLRAPPSASDAWVFDLWNLPVPTPPGILLRRVSKFTRGFTTSNVHRVYPTAYTHRLYLTPRDQSAVSWLSAELTKPREDSTLTALARFHAARIDTPYFNSAEDAVEAMWSGFESLLQIDSAFVHQRARKGFFLRLLPQCFAPRRPKRRNGT